MEVLDQNGIPVMEPDESFGRLVPERILVQEGKPYKSAVVNTIEYWSDGENVLYKQVEVEPEQAAVPPVYKSILRYIPYTPAELEENAKRRLEEEQARKDAEEKAAKETELRKELEALPPQVYEHDESIVALYEGMMSIQAESDEALTAIYEMMIGE